MIINDINSLLDDLYTINIEYSKWFYSANHNVNFKNIYKYRLKDLRNNDIANDIIFDYVLQLNRSISKKLLCLKRKYNHYAFDYRIKSLDTIKEKIDIYNIKGTYYVEKSLNDLCGIRIVIDDFNDHLEKFLLLLDNKKKEFTKFRYEQVNRETYHAVHCYFGVHSRTFPWELQIWDSNYKDENKHSHLSYEIERKHIRGGDKL